LRDCLTIVLDATGLSSQSRTIEGGAFEIASLTFKSFNSNGVVPTLIPIGA